MSKSIEALVLLDEGHPLSQATQEIWDTPFENVQQALDHYGLEASRDEFADLASHITHSIAVTAGIDPATVSDTLIDAFVACYMDGVLTGWRARELHHGERSLRIHLQPRRDD